MDPTTLAILITIASSVGAAAIIALAQSSPHVMMAVKRVFWGLNFLVVGPKETGKTSFYNYLRHNKLADDYPTNKTISESRNMSFDVDKGGDLKFQIQTSVDIPGEWYPRNQVEKIVERRPKVLIVFLDVSDSELHKWLNEFLILFRDALTNNDGMTKRLRAMVIVLNKIDKIKKSDELKRIENSARKMVKEILGPIMMDNVELLKIIPCTLLSKEKGSEIAANKIILSVIETLSLKKRLVVK